MNPLDPLIAALDRLAQRVPEMSGAAVAPSAEASGALPRYRFAGLPGGGDPAAIAIFAGIHGDEPAGSHAVLRFLERLAGRPALARGYRLHFYPVCNPTGFAAGTRLSQSGKDLNREFWKNSPAPEVRFLEEEIRRERFQGMISLHSDDTSDGIYGYVRGAVLTRALLEPALESAEKFLPRNLARFIDGFPAERGIISECYDGILTSPPELEPLPFEIIFETPQGAPLELQEQAIVAALETALVEYQKLLAFAPNL